MSEAGKKFEVKYMIFRRVKVIKTGFYTWNEIYCNGSPVSIHVSCLISKVQLLIPVFFKTHLYSSITLQFWIYYFYITVQNFWNYNYLCFQILPLTQFPWEVLKQNSW